ncbi:hypothetical protein SLEP1_g41747 [Rubroshorea leprosula]|uniref:Uncharacterized protein n=1 Tax=Rubroshorea leprosula TaxID=152421 RepID=A0AAV5L7P4_9ROSI|nr:hypothetical protein SLEP1_g41747 [Rubroshorea leprosula]
MLTRLSQRKSKTAAQAIRISISPPRSVRCSVFNICVGDLEQANEDGIDLFALPASKALLGGKEIASRRDGVNNKKQKREKGATRGLPKRSPILWTCGKCRYVSAVATRRPEQANENGTGPFCTSHNCKERKSQVEWMGEGRRDERGGVQHKDFPSGHPSWYCSPPSPLNRGVPTGSGTCLGKAPKPPARVGGFLRRENADVALLEAEQACHASHSNFHISST